MTSITTTDMTGEYATKLDNHLKSDDFFGTQNHPTAKFEISSAISQGNDLYKLTGDLTIKGIKKPIKFNATVKESNGVKTANALIKIDRSEFNVRYGSGSFFDNLGDKTIYDEFDLEVSLVTSK
jgi:polyisoprenoid-binding protein YceI